MDEHHVCTVRQTTGLVVQRLRREELSAGGHASINIAICRGCGRIVKTYELANPAAGKFQSRAFRVGSELGPRGLTREEALTALSDHDMTIDDEGRVVGDVSAMIHGKPVNPVDCEEHEHMINERWMKWYRMQADKLGTRRARGPRKAKYRRPRPGEESK